MRAHGRGTLLTTSWERVAVDEALKAWREFRAVLPRAKAEAGCGRSDPDYRLGRSLHWPCGR